MDDALFTVPAFVERRGNLKLRSENDYLRLVARLPPGDYDVSVSKHEATRSAEANRYYWKVVVGTVAEYMGEEGQDGIASVHELLKLKCNPRVVLNRQSGVEEIVGGTTRTGSQTFWEYVARCQRWAAMECNGLYIPDPDPALKKLTAAAAAATQRPAA